MLSLLFGNGNVISALAVFSRNALYKSTFYLLTYLHGNGTHNTTCANSTLLITAQPVQNLFETDVYTIVYTVDLIA